MRRLLALLFFVFPLLAHEPERVVIDSKVMGEARTAFVTLPASYARGDQRYPVIYLTDGQTQGRHTAGTIQALAQVGRMPELIVVAVGNTDRTRDLTPTRNTSEDVAGEAPRFPTSGGAAKFISFFETELIPEIDRKYRTTPYRVFAGHSFGGMFALEMLYTRPKLFSAWISVSPTVWWDDKYPLRRAKEFVFATPELRSTLILAVGKEVPQMNTTFDELKAFFAKKKPKGFEVHSFYFPDDDHTSVPIPAHYAALRTLFAPWHFELEPGTDVNTLWFRARSHAENLTKLYGFAVKVPEERANRIGYTLLAAQHTAKAIEVFRTNAENYPSSPNVHDSLGEAYEAAGDLAKARESFTKSGRAREGDQRPAPPDLRDPSETRRP
jgi:uncharacterized protein